MIFVALNFGRVNYTLTIDLVIKLPSCLLHSVDVAGLYLSFCIIIMLNIA